MIDKSLPLVFPVYSVCLLSKTITNNCKDMECFFRNGKEYNRYFKRYCNFSTWEAEAGPLGPSIETKGRKKANFPHFNNPIWSLISVSLLTYNVLQRHLEPSS